jgi:phosphoribosyl-AMP cyclohydrolase
MLQQDYVSNAILIHYFDCDSDALRSSVKEEGQHCHYK